MRVPDMKQSYTWLLREMREREMFEVKPYSSSAQQQTVVVPSPVTYWLLQLSSCPVQLAGISAIPLHPWIQ